VQGAPNCHPRTLWYFHLHLQASTQGLISRHSHSTLHQTLPIYAACRQSSMACICLVLSVVQQIASCPVPAHYLLANRVLHNCNTTWHRYSIPLPALCCVHRLLCLLISPRYDTSGSWLVCGDADNGLTLWNCGLNQVAVRKTLGKCTPQVRSDD